MKQFGAGRRHDNEEAYQSKRRSIKHGVRLPYLLLLLLFPLWGVVCGSQKILRDPASIRSDSPSFSTPLDLWLITDTSIIMVNYARRANSNGVVGASNLIYISIYLQFIAMFVSLRITRGMDENLKVDLDLLNDPNTTSILIFNCRY